MTSRSKGNADCIWYNRAGPTLHLETGPDKAQYYRLSTVASTNASGTRPYSYIGTGLLTYSRAMELSGSFPRLVSLYH